jgi:aldose 1-epimerase
LIAVTGAQYEIAAGEYAAVVTELGAGLRELRWRGEPVVAGFGADEMPPGAAGQLLVPWPNRIGGGRYKFGGAEFQLELSEPGRGNAIHGLTRWAGWDAVAHADGRVVLGCVLLGRPGYPFCLELRAEYALGAETGLSVRVTARNTGSRAAPFGTGSHPYLTAGTARIDECVLGLPASGWLPADERGLPAGPARDVGGTMADFRDPRPVGDTCLDHSLTGLARDEHGRAWAHLSAGGRRVSLWAGAGYEWLQVFTGDTLGGEWARAGLAVEPMTCPPDAFATGTDVITLAPGARASHAWGIVAAAR